MAALLSRNVKLPPDPCVPCAPTHCFVQTSLVHLASLSESVICQFVQPPVSPEAAAVRSPRSPLLQTAAEFSFKTAVQQVQLASRQPSISLGDKGSVDGSLIASARSPPLSPVGGTPVGSPLTHRSPAKVLIAASAAGEASPVATAHSSRRASRQGSVEAPGAEAAFRAVPIPARRATSEGVVASSLAGSSLGEPSSWPPSELSAMPMPSLHIPALPPLHIPAHAALTVDASPSVAASTPLVSAAPGGASDGQLVHTPRVALERTTTSSTIYWVGTPRDRSLRKQRSEWLQRRALGQPYLNVKDVSAKMVALINELSGLVQAGRFELRPVPAADIKGVQRALRRMQSVLLSMVYMADSAELPHLRLLQPFEHEVDSLAAQLSACLLAVSGVINGSVALDW